MAGASLLTYKPMSQVISLPFKCPLKEVKALTIPNFNPHNIEFSFSV